MLVNEEQWRKFLRLSREMNEMVRSATGVEAPEDAFDLVKETAPNERACGIVANIILPDSKPLSDAAGPRNRPVCDQCRQWILNEQAAGIVVVMPGIIDYEVRRKLAHLNATAGLRRLDDLRARLDFREINTAILDRAADLWAAIRRCGLPTAGWQSLDAVCILAAHALDVSGPGDMVSIATTNTRHLGRFPGIDAREWSSLVP